MLRTSMGTVLGTFSISNMAARPYTTVKRNGEIVKTSKLHVEAHIVGRVHTFGLLIGCKSGFFKKLGSRSI
jgi:hypothetical protein